MPACELACPGAPWCPAPAGLRAGGCEECSQPPAPHSAPRSASHGQPRPQGRRPPEGPEHGPLGQRSSSEGRPDRGRRTRAGRGGASRGAGGGRGAAGAPGSQFRGLSVPSGAEGALAACSPGPSSLPRGREAGGSARTSPARGSRPVCCPCSPPAGTWPLRGAGRRPSRALEPVEAPPRRPPAEDPKGGAPFTPGSHSLSVQRAPGPLAGQPAEFPARP